MFNMFNHIKAKVWYAHSPVITNVALGVIGIMDTWRYKQQSLYWEAVSVDAAPYLPPSFGASFKFLRL